MTTTPASPQPAPRHAPRSRTQACLALILAAERLGLIGPPAPTKRPSPEVRQLPLLVVER